MSAGELELELIHTRVGLQWCPPRARERTGTRAGERLTLSDRRAASEWRARKSG